MNKLLTGVAISAGVALAGAMAVPAQAEPVPASTDGQVSTQAILEFKNSKKSNTGFTAYFLPGCHGKSDKLQPGDWSELAFVSAVRVPEGTKLYYNGVLVEGRREKSHCHSFNFFSVIGVVKMKRTWSW